MRFLQLVVVVGIGIGALASGQAQASTAQAELRNAQGETVGHASLRPTLAGVAIALQIVKLPPGIHGVHIHAVGKCDPPDFASAQEHFNPDGKKHGLKNPEGPHAGDLPNLVIGPEGVAHLELLAPRVTLGAGANSLFHPGGTALVVHAGPDDEVTDPAGDSGARIACGVITR
jgi:Cu-Zn family superoxide dismutase